jgi:MOSC domain-containing protein YiiM
MKIRSIAVSKRKGTRKELVEQALLVTEHGIEGDAHAGAWHRQVSFLAMESIEKAKAAGLSVGFGDFAENIATEGIDWVSIPVGARFRLGESVLVEITQIGKECHKKCAIYYQAGDCIMPREGVFARVIEGGTIRCGDEIAPIGAPGAAV